MATTPRASLDGLPFGRHVGQRLGGEYHAQLIDGGIHRLLELNRGGSIFAGGPPQRLDSVDKAQHGILAAD